VAEGCPPSGINNAIREMASLLKKQEVGTDAMTSPDIDGGTIDGATIGGSSGVTIGVSDGTNSAPSIKFTSDTNTGIYRGGTDILKFVTAGTDAITIDASQGVTLAGNLDVSSGTIKLDGNYPVGTSNVALGNQALDDGSLSGTDLVAVGTLSLSNNTSGAGNVGIGSLAMITNTTGNYNTAVGSGQDGFVQGALGLNTSGSSNTAIGYQSLRSNTTASNNTAVGYQAGYSNTTGANNTAVGYQALYANTTGFANIAIGKDALDSNTEGQHNSVMGVDALQASTTGNYNTAVGSGALFGATTANQNTAVGYEAGRSTTVSGDNTYIGWQAGRTRTGSGNTCVGQYSGRDGTTGTDNTFIGRNSGYQITTGSNNTILGMYNGNQGGLDIRTSSNYIVLSDGDGNPRGIFDSSGTLLVGTTADDFSLTGFRVQASGRSYTTASGQSPVIINRITNDGSLILFYQNTTNEGSITVSGTTVSYNGGHLSRWSQFADNTRDSTLVKGTVMTNLDQMAEWTTDGVTEDNEQLNCMAVSSVEGDANVAGVFVNWDDDDDIYTNDMNVAMTGDMVIRIAQGTTVARGDLLMSAGDGTAKPQGDDIVRSKTIAKVTSTNVSHTYDDGTYLVPCVLMAC